MVGAFGYQVFRAGIPLGCRTRGVGGPGVSSLLLLNPRLMAVNPPGSWMGDSVVSGVSVVSVVSVVSGKFIWLFRFIAIPEGCQRLAGG